MTAPAITAAHTQATANPMLDFTQFPNVKDTAGKPLSMSWESLCQNLADRQPTKWKPEAVTDNSRRISTNRAAFAEAGEIPEWCDSITVSDPMETDQAAGEYVNQVLTYNAAIKSAKDENPQLQLTALTTLKNLQPLLKLGRYEGDSRAAGHELETACGVEFDYDDCTVPMQEAADKLEQAGIAAFLYPSFSATPTVHKWRALVPFSKSLPAVQRVEWLAVLCAVLGLEANSETQAPKQMFYFGRNPAQDYSTVKVEGACMDTIPGMITARVKQTAQAKEEHAAVEAAIKREKARDRKATQAGQVSPIEGFNETFSVEELLLAARYDKNGARFKHPDSTTEAGLVLLQCKDGKQRTWSHNGNDPLHGAAHDAFDCFCILQHGGDLNAALKAAGAMVCAPDGQTVTDHNQQIYRESKRGEWSEPEPLTEQTTAKPYPIDALPGIIGAAIREVVEIVKCPVALAANSALSVLATACQGVADVKPHSGLKPSPLSLFTLVIGESGERKTTADNFFSRVLNDWCEAKSQELEPNLKAYRAELIRWNAQRRGLEKAIENAASKGDPASLQKGEEAREKLIWLEQNEPAKVYAPDMVMEDTTPESIAHDLMHKWASAGILTSEAGTFFGGHGMKADSIARNMAQHNRMWEGGGMKITRRTSESFTATGTRESIGLAVQPAIIRQYHEQNGESARGSGFFARFLLAYPASTIGTRFLTVEEARAGNKANTSQLNLFHAKLHTMLEQQYANGKGGKFENLPVLQLSDDALTQWVKYCNNVESEMKVGGDMEEARDIASKSADNAARLAGLLHLFTADLPAMPDVFDETPIDYGEISGETMRAACKLATWYLYEARRFFGEVALPVADMAAVKLDEWLIAECKATGQTAVSRSYALQRAPGSLRKASKLNAALDTLTRANRARHGKEGSAAIIEVNPALLG